MRVNGVPYRTVWMDGAIVKMIDQRRLPFSFEVLSLSTVQETAEAIRDMAVRGAGAIGVTAGFGMAQAILTAPASEFEPHILRAASLLRATRPTAQNLFYAIDRVLERARPLEGIDGARARAVEAAQRIADEDALAGKRIGEIAQPLIPPSSAILTHCNAGWLAFADWGTALAPIYRAHRDGKGISVFVTETRPRAQGAKLTAWELTQEQVPFTLVPDTAVGLLMQRRLVKLVIVGADRIAANGDVANKIGTYQLAVLARAHQIPMYVAAPTTTIDLRCASGDEIPIEERDEEEVIWSEGMTPKGEWTRVRISPDGTRAKNWAFDVTPASYLAGLMTERGVIRAETRAIAEMMRTPAVSAGASGT